MAPGASSELIKDIVEGFCARYVPDGLILHANNNEPTRREDAIVYLKSKLGIVLDEHGKIPDVIVHDPNRNWIFLIDAVTSSGIIDVKRHKEISNIDWETDVWVAKSPTHIIHFNGNRLLGPIN